MPPAGDRLRGPAFERQVPLCIPSLPDLDAVLPHLRRIWDSGELTNGVYVKAFEQAVEARLPGRHVVAVSSCTQGLMLALRVLQVRGQVLVPSFTFAASAHAIVWAGCEPVFVECDPETHDVDVADVADRVGPETGAILAVYVSGNPPDVRALASLAKQARVRLVLDAAHALGSRVGEVPAGCWGDAEVFSLSPTKTVTACEGGLVSVRDPEIAERLRIGRNYGNPGDYDMRFVGLNARMSELHAVVGLESMKMLDANLEARSRLAGMYRRRLMHLPGLRFQKVQPENTCAFKDLGLRVLASEFGAERDAVREALWRGGVDTRTYFDPPVHLQRAYRHLLPRTGSLPATERLAREILDLPIYPGLRDEDLEHVCRLVEGACGRR